MSSKRKLDTNDSSVKSNGIAAYFEIKKSTNSQPATTTAKKAKIEEKIINLIPQLDEQTIYLDENQESYIKLLKIEPPNGLTLEEFEELWKLKPLNKLEIKIAGKIIKCPRYSLSYLKAYRFSGLNHEANMNLPKRLNQLLDYCKENYNKNLSQALVNWYEPDGSIGKHSDDTTQLLTDSEIFSFSFGPANRQFILEPKDKSTNYNKYYVQLTHNTLVIMGGKCQKYFYHHVPKQNDKDGKNDDGRRLNATFRCFK